LTLAAQKRSFITRPRPIPEVSDVSVYCSKLLLPIGRRVLLLDSKVAVVTGGAQGSGQAIALQMATQGAEMAVVDLVDATDTTKAVKAMERKAIAFEADAASFTAAEEITEKVVAQLGALHILVNNAGVPQPKSILELSEAERDRTIAINLKSSFNWTRAAAPHMLQARWGRVITISSMTAKHGGGTGAGAISKSCYSATKAGLLGLTARPGRGVGTSSHSHRERSLPWPDRNPHDGGLYHWSSRLPPLGDDPAWPVRSA
jgi:3-oxoacyl-[acyl-carrier protein] reductase